MNEPVPPEAKVATVDSAQAEVATSTSSAEPVASFDTRLRTIAERQASLLCVGLDPDIRLFPPVLQRQFARDPAGALVCFNRQIVEATADLVCAYKPNLGFYAQYGVAGMEALRATRALVPAELPVLLDAKVNDVGHTASAYASGYFDAFGCDAVTVSPYLGEDSLRPFLTRQDRGVFVLCRTSNPGAGDLQDLAVSPGGEPLYQVVARRIAAWGAAYGACGAVVGATYPRELGTIRGIAPRATILVPGIGAQGGDLEATVRAGLDVEGYGLLISASRAVLYASRGTDFARAARATATALRADIDRVRAASVA